MDTVSPGKLRGQGMIGSAFIECLHSAIMKSQNGQKFNNIVFEVNREMEKIVSEYISRYGSTWNGSLKQSFEEHKIPFFSSTAIKTLIFNYL